MKECDILRGSKHTLTLPTYFRGSELPQIYAPGEPHELKTINRGEDSV